MTIPSIFVDINPHSGLVDNEPFPCVGRFTVFLAAALAVRLINDSTRGRAGLGPEIGDAVYISYGRHVSRVNEFGRGVSARTIECQQMPSDPWMLHRIEAARPAGVTRNTAVHENDVGALLAALKPANVRPPLLAEQPSLSLVSPVRAYVEASNDSRGRAAEVAEALRRTFALE